MLGCTAGRRPGCCSCCRWWHRRHDRRAPGNAHQQQQPLAAALLRRPRRRDSSRLNQLPTPAAPCCCSATDPGGGGRRTRSSEEEGAACCWMVTTGIVQQPAATLAAALADGHGLIEKPIRKTEDFGLLLTPLVGFSDQPCSSFFAAASQKLRLRPQQLVGAFGNDAPRSDACCSGAAALQRVALCARRDGNWLRLSAFLHRLVST